MRKSSTTLIVLALGTAAVAASGPASARFSLNQCIGKNESCRMSCYVNSPAPPGMERHDPRLMQCLRQCSSGHAVCVDQAMTMGAKDAGPKSTPPKGGLGTVLSTGGLLDTGPGLLQSGPAATGAPVPKAPSAGGGVIR
ncbi:MAG: hypothetical protein FJX62_12130 [Alphaproteobacteria bacterium]|nr:hypothetical protein [Alphaproteobacteria bacterium]